MSSTIPTVSFYIRLSGPHKADKSSFVPTEFEERGWFAEEGTRTPTAFRPPAPKAGASANSATSALPHIITEDGCRECAENRSRTGFTLVDLHLRCTRKSLHWSLRRGGNVHCVPAPDHSKSAEATSRMLTGKHSV